MSEPHLLIERFFKEKNVMSIHLRTGSFPILKKGKPGEWVLCKLVEEPRILKDNLIAIENELLDICQNFPSRGSIEIEKDSTRVFQVDGMRIVLAKPPFSDVPEITAVRQVIIRKLSDYSLENRLKDRIVNQAEGIIVAGRPGEGKTTFAQALANFFAKDVNKIVKTLENPRDMQVVSQITRYGPLNGSMSNSANILLLVRPDYVIYDELRKTSDFKVYSDMRLAGTGMVGVLHASRPIDAIQRFLTRTELGLLPQIIDTVVFIESGEIMKILSIEMTVKVPNGMFESDLARPVVIVRDYETNIPEYEIYTFGEQTVMIPLKKGEEKRIRPHRNNKWRNYNEKHFKVMDYEKENFLESPLFDVLDIRMGKKNVIFSLGKKARNSLISIVSVDGSTLASYIQTNKKGEARLSKSKAMNWISQYQDANSLKWRFNY